MTRSDWRYAGYRIISDRASLSVLFFMIDAISFCKLFKKGYTSAVSLRPVFFYRKEEMSAALLATTGKIHAHRKNK
ncbi:hypothetical protein HDC90_000164 [Pedobacter sp. AK013]|nr:hypothetical protein [Pedobacter sp. AK013]